MICVRDEVSNAMQTVMSMWDSLSITNATARGKCSNEQPKRLTMVSGTKECATVTEPGPRPAASSTTQVCGRTTSLGATAFCDRTAVTSTRACSKMATSTALESRHSPRVAATLETSVTGCLRVKVK